MMALAVSLTVTAQVQLTRDNIKEVVAAMTLQEKAEFVVGMHRGDVYPPPPAPGMPIRAVKDSLNIAAAQAKSATAKSQIVTAFSEGRVKGAAGDAVPIERLGITTMVLADGPAGLRIDSKRDGDSKDYYCTAFPTSGLLAASWDTDLVERVTQAMGNEVKEYGADILLAPAINIHRNPLCGRNFEYYSEDPVLAGKMAAAYIRGIQSNGVGTSLKHFAANNQETYRNGVNAKVSERALREIYLKGFEIAIKEGQPWTVMSSYNKINGVLASENRWLLTDVLRGEWGFKGFVMTDWWAEENGARQIAAGNDMLMPGTQRQMNEIIEAVQNGTLAESQLDWCVENILRVLVQSPTFNRYAYSDKPALQAHAALTREAATEGMVLLENNGVLPISQQRVALIGVDSYDILVGGSGSGYVNRKYKVSTCEGLKAAGPSGKLPFTLAARYEDYPSADNFPQTGDDPATVEYKEDIFVGYRHFDHAGIQPLYPFGYGLSYTTFRYEQAKVEALGDKIAVSITVTNTGKRTGREVVQLYVATPQGTLVKPKKELKAFAKTELLQPGQSQTMTMTISREDLASYDEHAGCWGTDNGTYTIMIGASAADIRQQVSLHFPDWGDQGDGTYKILPPLTPPKGANKSGGSTTFRRRQPWDASSTCNPSIGRTTGH